MSPERLQQIEQHFRYPASASCNTEWALELVAEIRAMKGPGFVVAAPMVFVSPAAVIIPPPPPMVDPVIVLEAAPTPPEAPKSKTKTKGGK